MSFRKLRVEWIVSQAAQFDDPTDRQAYLDRACAGHEPLRREVDALLYPRAAAIPPPLPSFSAPPPLPAFLAPPTSASDRAIQQPHRPGRRKLWVIAGCAVVLMGLFLAARWIEKRPGQRISSAADPRRLSAALADSPEVFALDLQPYINAPLNKGWVAPLTPDRIEGNGFVGLEPGRHTLHDIEFELQGIVQLSSVLLRDDRGMDFPERIDGIQVKQKCHRLSFLQACLFQEQNGAVIGHYLVHFADGETRQVPLRFGLDVLDWQPRSSSEPTEPVFAWKGTNAFSPIRLFLQTWDNPKDDVLVDRLDFVSSMGRCAPFLVALTAERFVPTAPEFWISKANSLRTENRAAEALTLLERATTQLASSPVLWIERGNALVEAGRLDDALPALTRAVELSGSAEMGSAPARRQALLSRSQLLLRLERFAEAGWDYRRALNFPAAETADGATRPLPDYHLAPKVSVELGATNRDEGLSQIEWSDGQTKTNLAGGRECRTTASIRTEPYIYFVIDPTFKFNCGPNVFVEVEYFDSGVGMFGLHFDGVSRAYVSSGGGLLRDSQSWRVTRFFLNAVHFKNRQNAQADFRLWSRGGEFSVRRVTVLRAPVTN